MAAEQKISAALEKEFESVDKDCIRPLQVCLLVNRFCLSVHGHNMFYDRTFFFCN